MKLNRKSFYFFVLLFVVCFAIQAYWKQGTHLISMLKSAGEPFVIGAVLAYVVNLVLRPYEKLYTRFIPTRFSRFKRPLSMLLAYLTFILVISWVFSIVIPDLIKSLSRLTDMDTTALVEFVNSLAMHPFMANILKLSGIDNMGDSIIEVFTQFSRQILSQSVSVLQGLLVSVSTITSTVFNFFISIIFSLYVLTDKENLAHQFWLLVDTYLVKWSSKIRYVMRILNQRFNGFFVGQVIEAFILASLTVAGMTLFKLPYATTIGILVGFTNIVPVIGAYVGGAIGFVLVATQSVNHAFFFLIFLVILQQFESNLIYPRVVGSKVGLPGIWVLFSVAVGGGIFGFVGMLVAVPIAASVYQMIKDNVNKHRQKIA